MRKIYKGVWGCVSRLNYIRGSGGYGTGTEGWSSINLIHGGNGGGQYVNGIGKG